MRRTKGRMLRKRALGMLLAITMLSTSVELTAFAAGQDPASDITILTEETVAPEDSETTEETDQDESREGTDGAVDSDRSDDAGESEEEGSDKADDSDEKQNSDEDGESGGSDETQAPDGEEEADGSGDTQDEDEADEFEEPEDAELDEEDSEDETADEETETTGTGVLESSDIKLHTENSLGRLFEDAISTEVTRELQETGSGVYSVAMNGTQATVSFQTVHSGTLVVGVYEEDGVKLIATGSMEVAAGDDEAVVSIEADSFPEYFYLKACLVDTKSFRPYCEVYESEDYTEKMQAFYAKTTDDFDSSQILNLDEDESNNFIVFADSVKVILRSDDAETNKVIECDEDKLIYKIQNPDEEFQALKEGDIFVYYHADNAAIITKVSSVTDDEEDDGPVLTIYGEDPDFDAIIEFIKVGAENPKDIGINSYASLYAAEEGSEKWSLPDLSKEENGITLEVSEIGGESTIRVFRDSKEEIEKAELEISYGAKVSLSGELFDKEKRWELGEPTMPTNIPCVTISCLIEIKLEVEASLNVAGTLSGSIGVAVSADGDVTKIGKSPTFTVTKGAEVSVSLGLVFTPQLKFIHKKIFSVGLEIDFGLKLTFTSDDIIAVFGSERHACEECYGITLGPYLKITGNVVILFDDLPPLNLVDKDWTAAEAYYSVDHNKFGLGTCPYKEYKVTVKVRKLGSDKLITGANVNNAATTDNLGKAMIWLPGGNQVIYAAYNGETGSVFTNIDGKKDVEVILGKITGLQNDNAVVQVALGYSDFSAAITEDGSLYMWGNNAVGQLGIGSTTSQSIPVKVMDNTKLIRVNSWASDFCAAVTNNDDLYMWGYNSSGQLGDGTTDTVYKPMTPVLSDVKELPV